MYAEKTSESITEKSFKIFEIVIILIAIILNSIISKNIFIKVFLLRYPKDTIIKMFYFLNLFYF